MNKSPFFSIIIPTFDRAKMLKIAINSVLNQTFKDFELIIVDDGSTDSTKEIVQEYIKNSPQSTVHSPQEKIRKTRYAKRDTNIRYFHQKNKGVSSARNKGINKANGKYIAFLDSDDRFCTHKLEITDEYIKK